VRSTGTLLEVEALRVSVGGRRLIDAVSFAVRPGDVWCVLGANGAGKTLLLHTLAGLRSQDGGTIALAAKPLAQWRLEDAARWRGFLPQFNTQSFPMTVSDAVVMGRHPHLSRWAWEGEEEAAAEAPNGNGSLASVAKAAAMKAERAAIEQTLRQVHWNRRKAAQILGVSYKTLLNKIKECGISRV